MTERFIDRVQRVLAGRRITPWGIQIGLNKGTTARIAKNEIPGLPILNLISRVEHVSTAWLIDGQGSPLPVHREASDADCAAYLVQLLTDEPDWRIDALSDGDHAALILTQPGEVDFKGRAIPYTILEVVLCHRLGPASLAVVNDAQAITLGIIDADTMAALWRGDVVSWQLIGDEGLARRGEPRQRIDVDELYLRRGVGEDSPDYAAESEIVDKFNRLTPHNRDSVEMIIDRLLDGQE